MYNEIILDALAREIQFLRTQNAELKMENDELNKAIRELRKIAKDGETDKKMGGILAVGAGKKAIEKRG